jgi:hypothetical protein
VEGSANGRYLAMTRPDVVVRIGLRHHFGHALSATVDFSVRFLPNAKMIFRRANQPGDRSPSARLRCQDERVRREGCSRRFPDRSGGGRKQALMGSVPLNIAAKARRNDPRHLLILSSAARVLEAPGSQ